MITGRQIKAGRALLGWDAAELAEKAGLSRETVSNIENSLVQAHEKSLASIFRTFNENGVEFTDGSGVRLKPQNIETMEGSAGFTKFYDLVFDHLNRHGGNVCISGVDEALYAKYRLNAEADAILHRERMAKLMKQRDDIKVRILVKEGDYNFVASGYAEYKWQTVEHFTNASFYVFGDVLALISFIHDPAPLIIFIRSAAFAQSYRQSFDIAWDNAIKIPTKKPWPAK